MSQLNNSNYPLRSQCRSHGSCNCRNAPNLPRSRRGSQKRSSNTSLNSSDLSPNNSFDVSSDFDHDTETSSINRYSSSFSSSRAVVSSAYSSSSLLSKEESVLHLTSGGGGGDSDYNSVTNSFNSDNGSVFSQQSQSEVQLRSILVNSEKSKSKPNGHPRNVRFGFATSTPLTDIHNKALHEYEDISEDEEDSDEEDVIIKSVSDKVKMHPSRGRGGGRIVNQNLSKFTRLEETSAGRRRTTMQSVTNSRQSDTFEMSDGGADTTQEVHQLDTTYRVTRSGSRPPSSIHSHDSSSTSTTAVGGDSRAQRRRRQIPIIEEGEGDGLMFMTPTGNGNGIYPTTSRMTGRVRELLQSTRARLFGNQFSNYSNQSGFVGRDRNTVVGMANLGTIAGWRKNLLVFWSPKTTSQRMTSSHQNNGLVSDDESEDEQGQVDVVFSDGWFTSGRICRVLAKLIALLLLLMGLLYLAYLLWPVAALIASKTLDASKQYGLAFLEGVSSLFALLVQLGSVFVASLQNFSSSLFVGRGSQKNVIIGEPAAFPIVTPIVTQQQQQQAAPPIPPPFFSKEDYERLLKRIEDLEAQLRLSDGQISEKDKLYNQEIIGIRQDYENNRKELDLMRNSIPTTASFEDEIEKQVKISCTKNCPEPEVPPSRPDPVVNFDDTNVQALIDRAIQKYDADKTGRPDLALESGGGSILNTRCTKSSKLRNSVVSFWGFKIWSPPNNPRTIIQPGVVPGDCWAFEGSVGDVVIKLVGPAVITGFTVEHISKLVSPYGNIDSAPNKFQVLGLNDVNDWEKAHDYGIYRYEDNGQTLQYFDVLNMTSTPYPIVELKIMSNHGNMHHTCLYRFRVHGHLADWLSTPFTSTVVTSSLPEESDTLHDEDVE
ncbi:uncharacterized protein LOC110860720 isoform X2 [Folsomia candida]|uniref:uncharacterized protein LOC110860720 isoform X2 n=1 Tax=Folsomia candida TaxID=158441 RepID=UPI000B8F5CF6|nr:uncharacterized protein LOC110860720 isoform X2 [Folsomia candida]